MRVPMHSLLPALLIAAQASLGQLSYREDGNVSAAQRVLPSTGAAAALSNPAALDETRRLHLQNGEIQSISGKLDRNFIHASVAPLGFIRPDFPFGFALGFAGTWIDSYLDNSNAVYREMTFAPSFALFWHGDRDRLKSVSLGFAFPIQGFNAFGAVKSIGYSLDLGILGSVPVGRSRLAMGAALRNLANPEVKLPDGRGYYEVPGWTEASLHWTSPEKRWDLHLEHFISESQATGGPSESEMGINGWEVEFRPIPLVGVKVERPRAGSLTGFGTVFRPAFASWRTHFELTLGHDKFSIPGMSWLFGETMDEGRGYVFAYSLGAGF